METHLLFGTSLLMFLGWFVIVAGLYGSYRSYIEIRIWGSGLERNDMPLGMPIVGNTGIASEGVRLASITASVIGLVSLSIGGLLIGLGKTLSLIGKLHDQVAQLQETNNSTNVLS